MSKISKIIVQLNESDNILDIIETLQHIKEQYPTAELSEDNDGELVFIVNQFKPESLKDE